MAKRVVILHPIDETGVILLRQAGYEVIINDRKSTYRPSQYKKLVDNADAIVSLLIDPITDNVMNAAGSQLKIIANYTVGYDNIDLAAAKQRNIMVTNTADSSGVSVAEYVFALLFGLNRHLVAADAYIRKGKYKQWDPALFLGNNLNQKTIAIIGLGAIGIEVARRAKHGFDMNVIYTDVRRNQALEQAQRATYVSLEEALSQADVISLHVPLLPSTRHLIGAAQFTLMKPTALLINTARGPVVDEQALIAALKAKKIRGAALDVFEHEPRIAKALLKLPNCILTPHIASATIETRANMSAIMARNVIAALSGQEPPNLIKT